MRRALWSVFFVVFGLIALTFNSAGFAADEDEEKVAIDKLPKAVVDAVKKMFPKAEITGATKEEEEKEEDEEDEKGKKDQDDAKGDDEDDEKPEVLYEVTIKSDGKEIDVTVEESGEIEEIERTIDLKDLPTLVTEALAKKFPGATLKSAEVVYEVEDGKEELECYEVKLEGADKKEIEAAVEIEVEIEVDEE